MTHKYVAHPAYMALLAISLIWCSVILAFPLLMHFGQVNLASGIYLVFAKICHQNPARSFWLSGVPLPVCARCTSVYLSFLGAVSVRPLLKRTAAKDNQLNWLLMAALLLMTMDAALDLAGVWSNSPATRTLTGGMLGFVGGWIAGSVTTRINSSQYQTMTHG